MRKKSDKDLCVESFPAAGDVKFGIDAPFGRKAFWL